MLKRAECTPMYIRLRWGGERGDYITEPILYRFPAGKLNLGIMEGKTEGIGDDSERKG